MTEDRWQIRIFDSVCRTDTLRVQMGHLISVLCLLLRYQFPRLRIT